MKLSDAVALIGHEVHLSTEGGFLAPVLVKDVRTAYGRVRLEVLSTLSRHGLAPAEAVVDLERIVLNAPRAALRVHAPEVTS